MPQIKVNVNELITAANKFSAAADSCLKIQDKLKNATDALLSTTWNCKSKVEFINAYKPLFKNMCNYRDLLICISQDLSNTAFNFDDTDTSLSKMMSNGKVK